MGKYYRGVRTLGRSLAARSETHAQEEIEARAATKRFNDQFRERIAYGGTAKYTRFDPNRVR